MRLLCLCCLVAVWAASAQATTEALSESADDLDPLLAEERLADWTGDLDGMLERKLVRALVPYSKTYYFVDEGTARGMTYELLRGFEEWLNENHGAGKLPIRIVEIPTPRDELLGDLVEGRGDIAAGNLTITEQRERLVDFSEAFLTEVREIVVSGPSAPELQALEDLSGLTVHVRRSASYHESLLELNRHLTAAGLAPVHIVEANEALEDEDLLELVNAGLISLLVVDEHKANFWAPLLQYVELHPELALREDGSIAWAFRPNSPQLAAAINGFVATARKGTLLGNVLYQRYLEDNPWVSNPIPKERTEQFDRTLALFRDYGERYDFDWTMLAAVGYQESGLDQDKRSSAGAVGVMQLLPATAADQNVGVADISTLENNIHAGAKYLSFLRQRYFSGPEIDRVNAELFALAAYNAGPARIARLRAEAERHGLDPNSWFQNVEVVAARRIGRETVRYVSNVFKYYIAYSNLAEQEAERVRARAQVEAESTTASSGAAEPDGGVEGASGLTLEPAAP